MNGKAMFAGSFDPITLGHVNIIERSAKLFKKVYVVVAENKEKKCLFSAEERVFLVRDAVKHLENVKVVSYSGLMVDYARANGIGIMIRGVRGLSDFSYEFELAMNNKMILPDIETLFLPTEASFFLLRSSQIKEMASYGADISTMVTKEVEKALKGKFEKNKK